MTIEPGSAYRRIDRNRHQATVLLVLFAGIVAPIFGFLVQYFAVFFMLLFAISFLAEHSNFTLLVTIISFQVAAALLIIFLIIYRMVRIRQGLPQKLGAVPLHRAPETIIWRRLENLSIAAGVPTPQLYLLPDPGINALATGSDPEHSCIVVTRGVLEKLNPRELDGVLSHELSHIVNYDNRLNSTVAAILLSVRLPTPIYWLFVLAFLSVIPAVPLIFEEGGFMTADVFQALIRLDVREMLVEEFGIEGSQWSSGAVFALRLWVWLQLGTYFLGLPLVMAWPVLGRVIQALIARRREYLADAEASRLTRDPVGLASALKRIAAENPDHANIPHPLPTVLSRRASAVGHLCLVQSDLGLMAHLFRTHPPLASRIEALLSMAPPESLPLAAADVDAPPAGQLKALLSMPPSDAEEPLGLMTSKGWFPQLAEDPFTVGALAGIALQTILLIAGMAPHSPFGLSGALSAVVVMRRKEHFRWWPLVVMFIFGNYPGLFLGSILPEVLVAMIEPLAGAWLGLSAANGWPGRSPPQERRRSPSRALGSHPSGLADRPAPHWIARQSQSAANETVLGKRTADHIGESRTAQRKRLFPGSWRGWLLIAFAVFLALQLLGAIISILIGS